METDFAGMAGRLLSTAVSEAVDSAGPVKVSSTACEGNTAQILLDARTAPICW